MYNHIYIYCIAEILVKFYLYLYLYYTQNYNLKYIYWVSQKMYTKSIKCNLKLVASINNMKLFLDSTQSNLSFLPSLVGTHQVLREREGFLNKDFMLKFTFWCGYSTRLSFEKKNKQVN